MAKVYRPVIPNIFQTICTKFRASVAEHFYAPERTNKQTSPCNILTTNLSLPQRPEFKISFLQRPQISRSRYNS
jgi:hypothetical protein